MTACVFILDKATAACARRCDGSRIVQVTVHIVLKPNSTSLGTVAASYLSGRSLLHVPRKNLLRILHHGVQSASPGYPDCRDCGAGHVWFQRISISLRRPLETDEINRSNPPFVRRVPRRTHVVISPSPEVVLQSRADFVCHPRVVPATARLVKPRQRTPRYRCRRAPQRFLACHR